MRSRYPGVEALYTIIIINMIIITMVASCHLFTPGAQQIPWSRGSHTRECSPSWWQAVHMERTGDYDGDGVDSHDNDGGVVDQWSMSAMKLSYLPAVHMERTGDRDDKVARIPKIAIALVFLSYCPLVFLSSCSSLWLCPQSKHKKLLQSLTNICQTLMLALQGIEEQSDFSVPTGVDEIEKNIRTQIRRRSKLNLEDLKPTFA